jgi:hypothetical protein
VNLKPYEAHLEDQKAKKNTIRSSRRSKTARLTKARRAANQAKWQEELRKAQNENKTSRKSSNSKTPHNKLNASSPSYIVIYHVCSLNYPISKSSTNFVHNLFSFGNRLIKHKPREERDAMHKIKIRVLHKVYKHVFKQLYTIIMSRHANTRVNPHKETTKR